MDQKFEIQVSRELGEIHAKLNSVEGMIKEESGKITEIWKHISIQNQSLAGLKVKIFFVTSAISVAMTSIVTLLIRKL